MEQHPAHQQTLSQLYVSVGFSLYIVYTLYTVHCTYIVHVTTDGLYVFIHSVNFIFILYFVMFYHNATLVTLIVIMCLAESDPHQNMFITLLHLLYN